MTRKKVTIFNYTGKSFFLTTISDAEKKMNYCPQDF